jgi:hypothetical protein
VGDRDDVQRSVDLTVAAALEAMAVVSPGRDWDRCDPAIRAKWGVGLETLGACSLSDQDRRGQRAASCLGEQLTTMDSNEIAQLALKLLLGQPALAMCAGATLRSTDVKRDTPRRGDNRRSRR